MHAEQEATAGHMAAMRDDLRDRLLCAFPQVLPVHVAVYVRCVEVVSLLLLLPLFLSIAIFPSMHCRVYLAEVLGGSSTLT